MNKSIFNIIAIIFLLFSSCQNPENSGSTANEADTTVTDSLSASEKKPDEEYKPNTFNESTALLVKLTLQDRFKEDLKNDFIDTLSKKYIFFEEDLNGDSKNEIFVGLTGPFFCGSGGCSILLLNNQGDLITAFSVSEYPVIISNSSSNGWKDLYINSNGKYHVMKYDKKSYPSNPSVQPVLKSEPSKELTRALNFIDENYFWYKF